MNYNLNGSIARAHPYELDKTLSVEGAGADAKATGEAIAKVQKTSDTHIASKDNPHSVTKAQVGLGEVDNTSDADKPVSTAQAEAIEKAVAALQKLSGEEIAQLAELITAAQTAADTAQAAADNAMQAADLAQASADSKTAYFTATITLKADGWSDNQQTVAVAGVSSDTSQPVIITPDAASEDGYTYYDIQPTGQAENSVTFTCKAVPDVDIVVNAIGFTVSGSATPSSSVALTDQATGETVTLFLSDGALYMV